MPDSNNSRRRQVYCVGNAKSGTASLWGACHDNFHAAHEPERSEVLTKALQIADDSITDSEVIDWLRKRDERLQLDFDISWCNFFLLEHLVEAFPSAHFIVLVRDCYTWTESVIGHMLTRDIPPDAREFMEFWFRTAEHPHGEDEQRLKEAGLFSLNAHLETWNTHITRCAATIPEERMLLIRTHEFAESIPKLAEFLSLPTSEFDAQQCHLNQGTWQGQLAKYVDRELVEERVKQICGESMRRYYSEIYCANDAYSLCST
jgi:hypothetical protein